MTTRRLPNCPQPESVACLFPDCQSIGCECAPSSSPLRALSLRQPWAWAVVTVGKDIENRRWQTGFRGRFLIHAAKGCTIAEYLEARRFILDTVAPEYRGKGIILPGRKDMQRGGIIGEAEIVDCVRESDNPWFFGPYGFVLRNIKPLPFVPCRGSLGFFTPELPANFS